MERGGKAAGAAADVERRADAAGQQAVVSGLQARRPPPGGEQLPGTVRVPEIDRRSGQAGLVEVEGRQFTAGGGKSGGSMAGGGKSRIGDEIGHEASRQSSP
jgi:hypothetical protein